MKYKSLLCLTALLAVSSFNLSAGARTVTVQVVGTVDFPGASDTRIIGINNNNEIVGYAVSNGITFGFTRAADGQFSDPLIDPDDTHMLTAAYGLNDSGTVCGAFWGVDGIHGFFLSNGTYTTYTVPGQTYTWVHGLNNAGDFVGIYPAETVMQQGFVSIGGTVTPIDVPNGTYINAADINSSDQVVGSYSDTVTQKGYGFYSDAEGQFHYGVHYPGHSTALSGINDQGIMVGSYTNGHAVDPKTHGLVFVAPSQFATLDYAGSSEVVLTGINNKGAICGYYLDDNGHYHGLLARLIRTAD